jgi:anti-sigma B factor antagonist
MLEITETANGMLLTGRFDAAQVEKAKSFFDRLSGRTILDMAKLDYISSAGLGVLLATQKRLQGSGHGLKLIHLNSHIRDVLHLSGFDQIFDIE